MKACGITVKIHAIIKSNNTISLHMKQLFVKLWTSTYKTRFNNSDWFNCAAHMLWIGDRTRDLKEAHIEYFRG